MTKHGEPMAYFRSTVVPCQSQDCLTWPFYIDKNGYGQMRCGKRMQWVHRLACVEVHGPAPTPDHEAAHNCGKGNLGCVNPQHLEWKTRSANNLDKIAHGTILRGETHCLSKLTSKQVLEIRSMNGVMPHSKIAAIYGVTRSNIWQIQNGITWGWL